MEDAMKAKREQQSQPVDIERFREQLSLKIQRLAAEALQSWPSCDNVRCRRAKRCASQDYECIAKWRESLPPLSPEEAEASLQDFRIAIEARKRLGGESVTMEQLTEAIRKEKAARLAAMPPQEGDTPAPVAEETQLSPEKAERIDRIWNDYVASLPKQDAEDADDRQRERGPRITLL
jgi:type IV secretory pathway VirB10-like protein